MRILMLVHNTIARGTFNRAHSLGRHLVARGHEVTLLAGASVRAKRQRRNLNGVEVIEAFDPLPSRARESGLSAFDLVARMHHLLKESIRRDSLFRSSPDGFVAGFAFRARSTNALHFRLGGSLGIRGDRFATRLSLARALLGSMDQFLEDRVRRRADALTVINTKLRDRARQRFQAPIHLLPVGANSDLIQPLPKKEMRRRFGLPEDASIAVHAGLSPYDTEYLARSFVELVRLHPAAMLVVAGRHFPILDRIIAKAGFSSQLVRLGMLDREALTAAMACADVLLLPYTNRSVNLYRYPNKLGDYLSAGRPIVTNNTGDLGTFGRGRARRFGRARHAAGIRSCHEATSRRPGARR